MKKNEPFLGQDIEVASPTQENSSNSFNQSRQKRLDSSGFD